MSDDSRFDEFEYMRFERDGDVLVVTVDKPDDDLNKVDAQMHHELALLFKELREEREARAVLLDGTEKAFTAGGDFAWFPRFAEPGYAADIRLDGKSIVWNMLDVHLPIVCAVTGHAASIGISGAASYLLGDLLADAFGWRLAFASAGANTLPTPSS